MVFLSTSVEAKLRRTKDDLSSSGRLIPLDELAACYALFRDRFGPRRLAELSGTQLLETMHLHGNRDSLVYWLEFKADEEFPPIFGSIAGGNALKFGLFHRKATGEWVTGHATNQVAMSLPDAVAMATMHRDQLVAASAVLDGFPGVSGTADYVALQERLEAVAPDVQDSGWGHKYLSLLHPDKLDDYHTSDFQRFHLISSLLMPPSRKGRYLAAGDFVVMAAELGVPLNHLTTILNEANGRPRRTWRIGTRVTFDDEPDVSIWTLMLQAGVAAIGWDALDDLGWVKPDAESKDRLKREMKVAYGSMASNVASRKAGEIFDFVANVKEGDVVLAADGATVLGVGRVAGPYRYDVAGMPAAPHRRAVRWLDAREWKTPVSGEGLRTTVYSLRDPENLIAVEKVLLEPTPPATSAPSSIPRSPAAVVLDGIPKHIQDILERKGQAILYGPPGTGKTHWARRAAKDLAAVFAFGMRYADLSDAQRSEVSGVGGLVRVCTFHPGYGYEDFIEGFRPAHSDAGQLVFERRDGLFKRLCAEARARPDRQFFLLIDEINRGDVPRIFGELITLIEMDKRGDILELPISGERFSVPKNLRIIGTMNTADRSIALLDTALRRRFGFVELAPNTGLLAHAVLGRVPLKGWLEALNAGIIANVGRDARNLQIGHAFLLEGGEPIKTEARFASIVADDIVPLLQEYCYEDYGALAKILGDRLVDVANQRIRTELFERIDELMEALAAISPDLATSPEVVSESFAAPEPEPPEDDPVS